VVLLCVFVFHLTIQTGIAKPDAVREGSVITCTQSNSQKVSLRSTDRMPEASGNVRVERKGGTTKLDVEVDGMKPASLFGGDYNTYVLWVVPPAGPAENFGEVTLDGSRGELRSSTAAASFAILITAEPHYLVTAPSAFVVLENKPTAPGREVRYSVLEGAYNFERSNLDDTKHAKGIVHSELKQAFTALRLAKRAGAATLAAAKFSEAQQALDETVKLWHEHTDRTEIAAQARETVRLAVAAQHLANDRAFQGARVEREGAGGGNDESERRDLRGSR
jgi:hypothetical protein